MRVIPRAWKSRDASRETKTWRRHDRVRRETQSHPLGQVVNVSRSGGFGHVDPDGYPREQEDEDNMDLACLSKSNDHDYDAQLRRLGGVVAGVPAATT